MLTLEQYRELMRWSNASWVDITDRVFWTHRTLGETLRNFVASLNRNHTSWLCPQTSQSIELEPRGAARALNCDLCPVGIVMARGRLVPPDDPSESCYNLSASGRYQALLNIMRGLQQNEFQGLLGTIGDVVVEGEDFCVHCGFKRSSCKGHSTSSKETSQT